MDYCVVSGFIYFLAFLHQHYYVEPYPLGCVLYMQIPGILIVIAFQCLNLSVLSGKGAISAAIS
jgi:hypothetical protein